MALSNGPNAAGHSWQQGEQFAAPLVAPVAGPVVGAENGRALRLLALAAVVAGLITLTAAACVLSYSSVHVFALQAGVSDGLARIYPVICDAMLVISGCSVLALRGAGLVSRMYAWLCFILLLAVVAACGVAREAGLHLPSRPAEITAAVFPWALVLVAFGLLLALLRHARRRRHHHQAQAEVLTPTVRPEPLAIEPPPAAPAEQPGEPPAEPRAPAPQAEMRLRASTQRRVPPSRPAPVLPPRSSNSPSPDTPATPAPATMPVLSPAAASAPDRAAGYTGNTVPRGNLSPAPTDQASGAAPANQPTADEQPADEAPASTDATGEASGQETTKPGSAGKPGSAAEPPRFDRPHSSPTPPSE